jgi:hypothetical protein
MEVKEIIPNLNRAVIFNGSEYILTGSTIRKDEQGNLFYQAELLDKNKNSVSIIKLGDVKTG